MSRYPIIDAKLKQEVYQEWLQNEKSFHTTKNYGGSFKDYWSRLVRCIRTFNDKPIPGLSYNFEDLLPRVLASNLGDKYVDNLFTLLEQRTRLSWYDSPSLNDLIRAITTYKEWVYTQGLHVLPEQRLTESELTALNRFFHKG